MNWLVIKRIEQSDGRGSADERSGSMGVSIKESSIGGETKVTPKIKLV